MAQSSPTVKQSWRVFDGTLTQYTHQSESTQCQMKFSVYTPDSISNHKPAHTLFWLSGLTCDDTNFAQKATIAFKEACQQNLVIVLSDTSPRGDLDCPGDKESWDFGQGAGFYLNATTEHFKKHYNMYDYITIELWDTIKSLLGSTITSRRSVFGHSMGGLGALNIYLKSGLYTSCSAFAPIVNPMECPWGQKAFTGYLGNDKEMWKKYDPTFIIANKTYHSNINITTPILIDQGTTDSFLLNGQLLTTNLINVVDGNNSTNAPIININMRENYDHSYFFISTFIVDHIQHHAKLLSAIGQ